MPGLFSRRSRSVSTSRSTPPTTSSSAQSAAAQAFLASRAPQSHLSSSAAAAALRSMTPPPTSVANVQTKRMVNRQGSNASATNAPRGRSTGALQRRSSSASMTERTFRGTSPGRASTTTGASNSQKSNGNHPPVPAVPEEYIDIPPIPQKSNRRSASVDFQPTPTKTPMGRGQSIDRFRDKSTNESGPAAKKRVPSLQTWELDASDNNNSPNFSYPRGTRPNSPPPRSPITERPSSPLRSGITRAEAEELQYEIASVAQRPVKKKTKKLAPQVVEGSHLHAGTMGGKPKVTPLEPGPPGGQQTSASSSTTTPKAKKKATITGQASHFPSSPTSPTATSPDSDTDSSTSQQRERKAKRASGSLTKQPSVVREDWEGEQDVSDVGSVQKKNQTTEANMSRKIEEPSPTTKAALTAARLQATTSEDERGVSRSPSRSTRFSHRLSTDITASGKHEPLGRSISPAKSAMKQHSPSPQSNRNSVIEHDRGRDASRSPSEATDVSVDGGTRRRKAAHVKFDTNPEVVGVAAEPIVSGTPVLASPQHKNGKTWIVPSNSMNNESSEHMGNRPQLPTFGSVRKDRRDDVDTLSPTADIGAGGHPSSKTSSTSSLESVNTPTTKNTSISSDHAIGAVIAQDARNKGKGPDSPLPPVVTSVEGAGLNSDSDNDSSDEDINKSKFSNVKAREPEDTNRTVNANAASPPSMPQISVQPATPGVEDETKPTDQWLVDVPGSFPSTSGQSISSRQYNPPKISTQSIHSAVTQHPAIEEESASDNDSIYSDAAEDLSDLEGDGFGSIDAVVHSPMASPANRNDRSLHTIDEDETPSSPVDTPASWDQAQSKWSNIAKQAKQTALQPAAEIVEKPAQEKPRKKKKQPKMQSELFDEDTTPYGADNITDSPYRAPNQPSAYPAVGSTTKRASQQKGFRSSMRDQAAEVPATSSTMRSSLRNSQDGMASKTMRTSMRGTAQPPSQPVSRLAPSGLPAANRPASSSIPAVSARGSSLPATASRKQTIPVNADSDSESSFKRSRRSKKNTDSGSYTMKRSMRGAPAPQVEEKGLAARNGVRSLSPVQRRPLSPAMGQSSMRTSMRSSFDLGTRTLRDQPQQSKRNSLFSRNKSPQPGKSVPSSGGLRSRFADSDDEDERRPAVHKSRFEDSSDEEPGPISFRPVRGIPRGKDDADSTDLADSSDEESKNKNKKALTSPKALQIQPVSPAQIKSSEPASPSSPTTKKKRGLFGMFRKGKEEDSKALTSHSIFSKEKLPIETAGVSGEQDNTTANLGFSTDAEREALVAATQKKLEAERARAMSPAGRPRPQSPPGKLQRRVTPQRIMSDTWPLPPKIPDADIDRPNTADATTMGTPTRPGMGDRLPTNETVSTSAGPSNAYGRSGKKKRFGLLRKAFGLKD